MWITIDGWVINPEHITMFKWDKSDTLVIYTDDSNDESLSLDDPEGELYASLCKQLGIYAAPRLGETKC